MIDSVGAVLQFFHQIAYYASFNSMVSLTDRHFLRLLLSCCVASTSAPVLAGSKFLPVLNRPITDRSGLAGSPFVVNLSAAFGMEPVDDDVVRFTSQFSSGAVPVTMDMALFSNRTPVTRQNFLKYVTDGDYVNSFVHRSVPGFVIQGGASNIINGSIGNIPTDPPITNEFDVSNTVGTISMAKLGGNPNSATSQWFVSLGANSDILDPQNGGFTVFGRVTRSTFQNAQSFGNPSIFPTFNYGGIYAELPLFSTHAPPNRQISEFILFPSVALVPMPAGEAGESSFLAYSVISNSNPGVATASIGPVGFLNLSPAVGQSGTTAIRVRATDSLGNTVEDTFVLTVVANDTYTTWASRNTFTRGQSASGQNPDADAWNNFLEYAFLGDPGVARPSEQIIFQESLGMAPGYQALTFPVRKSAPSLSYAVEGNDGLSGPWTEIWKSTDGFVHPQVVTAVDQVDRTVLTIKDTSAIGAVSKRFMRVRAVE